MLRVFPQAADKWVTTAVMSDCYRLPAADSCRARNDVAEVVVEDEVVVLRRWVVVVRVPGG